MRLTLNYVKYFIFIKIRTSQLPGQLTPILTSPMHPIYQLKIIIF